MKLNPVTWKPRLYKSTKELATLETYAWIETFFLAMTSATETPGY